MRIAIPPAISGRTPTLFTSSAATFAQMIDVPATARYATPVFIAEYPSTCCMYSVSIRNIENSAVPRMKPATFAPSTVFVRRIPKRISGSVARSSQTHEAAEQRRRERRRRRSCEPSPSPSCCPG